MLCNNHHKVDSLILVDPFKKKKNLILMHRKQENMIKKCLSGMSKKTNALPNSQFFRVCVFFGNP